MDIVFIFGTLWVIEELNKMEKWGVFGQNKKNHPFLPGGAGFCVYCGIDNPF
jgi:hypothetical protein